jgi:hypothetical protein
MLQISVLFFCLLTSLQACDSRFWSCISCLYTFQYQINKTCFSCPYMCRTCQSSSTCTACISNYYLWEGNCLQCPYNCKSCSVGCQQCIVYSLSRRMVISSATDNASNVPLSMCLLVMRLILCSPVKVATGRMVIVARLVDSFV